MAINLMINGLSPVEDQGNMAGAVLDIASSDKDFDIVPFSLTGDLEHEEYFYGESINLVKPADHRVALGKVKDAYKDLIIVDATVPNAYFNNGCMYVRNKIPFVMMTTTPKGSDHAGKLKDYVEHSDLSAAISPNWGLPLLGVIGGIEAIKEGTLEGFDLYASERHQLVKKDPSGTGRKVISILESKGAKLAEPMQSVRLDLQRHGYHTFQLVSEGDSEYTSVGCVYDILEYIGKNAPGTFEGFKLDLTSAPFKSHAPMFANILNYVQDIARKSIPEENIHFVEKKGNYGLIHAKFTSLDNTVRIILSANRANDIGRVGITTEVDGVNLYAHGALKAAKILAAEEEKGKVYSGTDVLKYGVK